MTHLMICTDGACIKNGKPGALAGYGVYFGPNDSRNISKPLEGVSQTNNRAELQAFIVALTYAQTCGHQVEIVTDSSYCRNGFMSWIYNWAQSDWMKSNGDPVLNRDLWEQVWNLKQCQASHIKISWIKGHSGHEGNEAADKLATAGLTLHPSYKAPLKKVRKRKRKQMKTYLTVGTQTDLKMLSLNKK